MPAGQTLQQEAASSGSGLSSAHDLFALTDEQILEIEPEAQDVEISGSQPTADGKAAPQAAPTSWPAGSSQQAQSQAGPDPNRGATQAAANAEPGQPPEWLAQRMKDPWNGEETRDFWQGIQQGRQEAAAYREVFAKPEEARAAVERVRVLDDIDRAYFGTAGKSAEETSGSRVQLAAMMMREDPAAFREMVFAGLHALEEAGKGDAQNVGARFSAASSPANSNSAQTEGGLKSAPAQAPAEIHKSSNTAQEAHVAAYAAFEKAANEDLERSVGATIERTLKQALPGLGGRDDGTAAGSRRGLPVQERLNVAVRQDVEASLKGDRQLGEQVAQILSGRRLDNETRAQVVRLIGERAQQLVPTAAKRVLNDWTQTTFAAHRAQSTRADAASSRREVALASSPAASPQRSHTSQGRLEAGVMRPNARRIDYRKLSDEQILEL